MPLSWIDRARLRIADLDRRCAFNTDASVRMRIIDEGYPFGERRHTPYKAWLRARQEYIALKCPELLKNKAMPISPLDRAKWRAERVKSGAEPPNPKG